MLVSPRIRVPAIAVLLAASVPATAANGGCAFSMVSDLQHQLEKHTQAMLNALATGDKAPWMRCLSERALITGDDGQTQTKAEFLAQLRPLPPGYGGQIRMEKVRVLEAKDAIVMSYDLDEQETIFGHAISQRYHTTDAWTIEDGQWRLIASQALRLYQDPRENRTIAQSLPELAGSYELAPGITYTVTTQNGELYGQRSGRKKETLLPETTDVFFRKGIPGRKIFLHNAQGEVTGIIDRVNGADLLWTRTDPAKPKPMKHFVIIYRQTPKQFSEEEQKRRADEVRAWALGTNQEGHRLDGRILQKDARTLAPASGASTPNNGDPVIAISFLDARDLEEAMQVAQTHPGLKYGVAIEVREWEPPPVPPPTSQ